MSIEETAKKLITIRALGERKPPATLCQFFPSCSPGERGE